MKKIIFALLACLLLLTACGGEATTGSDTIADTTPDTTVSQSSSQGLQIFDGNGLTDQYIDPLSTGKVTILNFWGTWCPYCLYEMPHLDQLAAEYQDSITVIAVHTDLTQASTESYLKNYDHPVDYVAENHPDSKIIFAADVAYAFYDAMGGESGFPYTVILDEDGAVLTSFYGYKNYEAWVSIVESLIK